MLDHYHQTKDRLLRIVERLVELAHCQGSAQIKLRLGERVSDKLRGNVFNLVVVGEFNHGKSSLINAMLGSDVLPTGVTPTTAVIHELGYGDVPHAELVNTTGVACEIPFEEIARFQVERLARTQSGEDVDVLRIRFPADLLSQQVVLVDTPGVNDLSLQRADITYKYVSQADAVLFLLDSGQILKESERVFLQDHLLAQSKEKIVFVVTKIDLLSDDEMGEAMSYARAQLGSLVDAPSVFPVSSTRARAGDDHGSGVASLIEHINKVIENERGYLLLRHACADLQAAGSLLSKRLVAHERALRMSQEELERRLSLIRADLAGHAATTGSRRAQIRESLAAIRASVNRDMLHFASDMTANVANFLDERGSRQGASLLGDYLSRSFETWARDETERVGRELEALAERTASLVAEDARDAGRRLADVLGTSMMAEDVGADRIAFDLGAVTLAAFGVAGGFLVNWMLGGMLIVVMPALAFYFRGRFDHEVKRNLKQRSERAVEQALELAGEKFETLISSFGEQLDQWVLQTSEEVHREVLAAFENALDEKMRGDAATALALSQAQRDEQDVHRLIDEVSVIASELSNQ